MSLLCVPGRDGVREWPEIRLEKLADRIKYGVKRN